MTPHEMINPTGYVLGFAFSHTMRSVVLIEKLKPDWQAGKLNGVGGKIEPGENAYDAMAREFFEETGWAISYGDWHLFEIMRFRNGAYVYCFTTQLPQGADDGTGESRDISGQRFRPYDDQTTLHI